MGSDSLLDFLFTFIFPCMQAEFPAGHTIFRKGDVGEDFYIVHSGTALVLDDQGQVSSLLPAVNGQHF